MKATVSVKLPTLISFLGGFSSNKYVRRHAPSGLFIHKIVEYASSTAIAKEDFKEFLNFYSILDMSVLLDHPAAMKTIGQ